MLRRTTGESLTYGCAVVNASREIDDPRPASDVVYETCRSS